jgi:hypothetical protein
MTNETMLKAKDDDDDKLEQSMQDFFNKGPLGLRLKLQEFLETVVDAGTSIDSGYGLGGAELWPIIDGVEYHIAITDPAQPPVEELQRELDEIRKRELVLWREIWKRLNEHVQQCHLKSLQDPSFREELEKAVNQRDEWREREAVRAHEWSEGLEFPLQFSVGRRSAAG